MKFKGFDDYFEIFRGGKQTDSNGKDHNGDQLIDKAIASFKPGEHEPPIVIGHPAENAPAYGWIEDIKTTFKDGVKVLLAKAKQVVPEFSAAVEQGLFKKRSASFYPDGRLRHVGFLGAVPPAVKGLADIGFKEQGVVFEFEEKPKSKEEPIMEKFAEFFEFLKFWKKFETELGSEPALKDQGKTFSEADLEAAKTKAAEEAKAAAKAEAEAEFAEKQKTAAAGQRKKEIAAWVDERVKGGKILPSWKDAGLAAFMERLDADEAIQFAEGDQNKKPALKWFQDFLESFEKAPLFKEFATKNGAGAQFTDEQKQVEAGRRIAAKVNPKKE
jgi:hypothetical protein